MKEVPAAKGSTPVGSDEGNFRSLYDRYYDAVLAYFLRRDGRTNAQDLTAEVFLVAWRRFGEVPDGEEARLWLYGVAANVAAHQRRRVARLLRLNNRLRSVPSPRDPDEPEPHVVRRAEYEQVLTAAARLRPADQEILRLAAWEELPHDQIALLLGVSVAAVDQRLHRAKRRLTTEYRRHHTARFPRTEEGGTL